MLDGVCPIQGDHDRRQFPEASRRSPIDYRIGQGPDPIDQCIGLIQVVNKRLDVLEAYVSDLLEVVAEQSDYSSCGSVEPLDILHAG